MGRATPTDHMNDEQERPDTSPPPPRERYELRFERPDPLDIPRVAPDIEPIGGQIRVEVEDFEVEEVPLYVPCGEGPHVYVKVRKRNRTTLQIREFLAKRLGVHAEEIGFAGFKDKRAVTTQTFSIHGVEEGDLARVENRDWIEVLARACGHAHLRDFAIDDLTTWKIEMTRLTGVAYGGVAGEA